MEVILKEDLLSRGYVGDRIKVKGGYARNFLLPRGIAVEASSRNQKILKHQLAAIVAKRARRKSEAEEFAKTLSQVIVEFTLKIGQGGKSFGSVSAKEIEAKLNELGYKVDKRQIKIPEPIKGAGTHAVEIKLHSEVVVPVSVKVIAAKEAVAEEETQKKRGRAGGKGRARKEEQATTESTEVEAAATEESES